VDKKTFRITKVTAKVRKMTCETCGEQISRGHKVSITGTHYCDKCVVAGFLKSETSNRGFFTRLHMRLTGRANEAIEVERYIEKRNQRSIVTETDQTEKVVEITRNVN
jgi:late competence protein required for DNA uptake (superfamily II DNA/RNA helicase)